MTQRRTARVGDANRGPTPAGALAGLRFLERGLRGPIEWLAPAMFVIANVVIGAIFVRTVWLLTRGRLLPVPAPVATAV